MADGSTTQRMTICDRPRQRAETILSTTRFGSLILPAEMYRYWTRRGRPSVVLLSRPTPNNWSPRRTRKRPFGTWQHRSRHGTHRKSRWQSTFLLLNPSSRWRDLGLLKIYDSHTGDPIRSIKKRPAEFCCVQFSHDGKLLAASAWDGTIQVWQSATLDQVCEVFGHANFVNSLAFSPDGRRLASASSNGDVRLWDPHAGDLTAVFHGSLSVSGNPARGLAFSPDGTALLSATSEGPIRIWRLQLNRKLPRVSDQQSELATIFRAVLTAVK